MKLNRTHSSQRCFKIQESELWPLFCFAPFYNRILLLHHSPAFFIIIATPINAFLIPIEWTLSNTRSQSLHNYFVSVIIKRNIVPFVRSWRDGEKNQQLCHMREFESSFDMFYLCQLQVYAFKLIN